MKKYIVKIFVLLNFLVILTWVWGLVFPIRLSPFLGLCLQEKINNSFFWSRANFDGVHHVSIARSGYGYLQQAFFPFYAWLIRAVHRVLPFLSLIESGVFISLVCFLGILFLLAKLFKLEGEKKAVVKKSLLFLVIFPTSFYFVSVYTESLFLFLALLSFYLAHKKHWLYAALVAGLASYTRLVGIFLLPALLWEYYLYESKRGMKKRLVAAKKNLKKKLNFRYFIYLFKTRWPHIKNGLFIFTSGWGLVVYMLFLNATKQDYLYFLHVQPGFGAQRTIGKVIMFYQVIWRYIKMIFTVNPLSLIYFNVWFELLVTLLFAYLLILGWFKFKIRSSWMLFSTLAFILPSVTGTFSSMPRYVLVCFPCFLVLAKIKLSRWGYYLSVSFFVIVSYLFFRGHWIA